MLQNVQVSPLTPTCQSSAVEFGLGNYPHRKLQAAGHRAHSRRLKLPCVQFTGHCSVTPNGPMAAGRQRHSSPRDRHSLCNRDKYCHAWESTGLGVRIHVCQTNSFPNIPLWLSTLSLFWTALFVTAASRDTFAFNKAWLYSKSKLPFLAQFREFSPSSCCLERPWRTLCSENSETFCLDSNKRRIKRAEEQAGLLFQDSVQ